MTRRHRAQAGPGSSGAPAKAKQKRHTNGRIFKSAFPRLLCSLSPSLVPSPSFFFSLPAVPRAAVSVARLGGTGGVPASPWQRRGRASSRWRWWRRSSWPDRRRRRGMPEAGRSCRSGSGAGSCCCCCGSGRCAATSRGSTRRRSPPSRYCTAARLLRRFVPSMAMRFAFPSQRGLFFSSSDCYCGTLLESDSDKRVDSMHFGLLAREVVGAGERPPLSKAGGRVLARAWSSTWSLWKG